MAAMLGQAKADPVDGYPYTVTVPKGQKLMILTVYVHYAQLGVGVACQAVPCPELTYTYTVSGPSRTAARLSHRC
jgi:hypothetical protein